MRNLWKEIDNSPETPEGTDLLDRRADRIELGEAELLDWDKVKGSIGRR